MSVRVQCGTCGAPYAVAAASLGKRVKCKKCGAVFVAAEPPPVEAELVADGADDEYNLAGGAPDVAPSAAPAAAATTVWDAKRPPAAAVAAAQEEAAKPAWRKPGVLVPVAMLAVGGAIVAAVLLSRPAKEKSLASGAGGAGTSATATTRPRGPVAPGPGGAAAPSAADTSEEEIGESSALFSVKNAKTPSGSATAKPTPSIPTATDPSRDDAGAAEAPSPTAGASQQPPTAAAAESSPRPTTWLVRPDPSTARPLVLAKKLSIPVRDAEVIFPDQPSPFVVIVRNRDDGFEWELWNLEGPTKTYSFKSKNVLAEMIVSPDGVLAAGIVPGRVNDVETWSLRQGTPGKRVREAEGEDTLLPVCFVGEEMLVTTVAGTRKLTLWNVPSGKSTGEVALDRDLQFGAFAQSPGGNYLAMFANTRLLIYSFAEQKLAGDVAVPEPGGDVSLDRAAGLTFSPDGSELAGLFGGRGGPVRVVTWDVKTGRVTADVVAADKPGERLPPGTAQMIRPIAWLLDGTGWLLYGNLAVARSGGKTLFRQKPGPGGGESDAHWRPADRDSFLTFEGKGAKRFLKAAPVPPRAE